MATTTVLTVRCENCGKLNRVPAAAEGKPRCGNCKAYLPWIVAAGDDDFTEVAERTSVPVRVHGPGLFVGEPAFQPPPRR
ncbi:MAG: hypothetical protein ACRDTT_07645 [Pseudonocardiaceae bacterium]